MEMIFLQILAGLLLLIPFGMLILFLLSRVSDSPLPHTFISSEGGAPRTLAVVLSGIRGWLAFEQKLAENLSNARMDVIGIDCLRYFYRKKKTPEKLSEDIAMTIREWSQNQPGLSEIILIGNAKGADVLPFAVNRLEPRLRSRIQMVALLGVDRLATFRIRLSDLFGRGRNSLFPLQVTPEIRKLDNIPGLCVYGDKDRVSLCRNLKRVPMMDVQEIKGGPVFQDANEIADLILKKYFVLTQASQDSQAESSALIVEKDPDLKASLDSPDSQSL